ncbi:hypothetical protein TrVFT333_009620 [Trichoderma virens FT-333]|nr:hypothetical protein TrVFT333_009620 [Trichoderma virens FT-333]
MLQSGEVEVERMDSFRGLETGHVFEILMDEEEAAKMKMALDLKWAVVRIAAISNFDWRSIGFILNDSGQVDREHDGELEE